MMIGKEGSQIQRIRISFFESRSSIPRWSYQQVSSLVIYLFVVVEYLAVEVLFVSSSPCSVFIFI